MPLAPVNDGIEVFYEELGSGDDPPLLLVMGLGAQMLSWDTELCELLVSRGFRVIRFDNRDVGLSTKLDDQTVDFAATFAALLKGQQVEVPYLLSDMADDAVGLLDHLGIGAAHIVGASMGGMIVQTMAIEHPERVLSMTSIMSTTGATDVGQPGQEAMRVLLQRPPADREGAIEHSVEVSRLLHGPSFPFDEDRARRKAAEAYDRSFYPEGVSRQLLAIVASGDRTAALRGLDVPTLVIHGDHDPLVTYSGGQATAAAIPGAELLTIEEMGHSIPEETWPQIVDAIARLVERANARA